MLDIGGSVYVINFKAIDKLLNEDKTLGNREVEESETKEVYEYDAEKGEEVYIGKEVYTKKYEKGKEIDMTRYEMIRMLFEVLLTFNEEFDDELGFERALGDAPLPFKISFNTLVEYGILKEK